MPKEALWENIYEFMMIFVMGDHFFGLRSDKCLKNILQPKLNLRKLVLNFHVSFGTRDKQMVQVTLPLLTPESQVETKTKNKLVRDARVKSQAITQLIV